MGFQIGLKDIIDILLVAIILFETFRILKRSGVVNLFWGIFAFVVVWFLVSYVFTLDLTGAIFDRIISVGAIALIVIFQDEIRAFFYHIGSRFSFTQLYKHLHADKNLLQKEHNIKAIITACEHMSQTQTGALMVVTRTQDLNEYVATGEEIDAEISARMIENIFFKNTPLHDGALIISHGRLTSAACILPISKNTNLPQAYGLRHRAALGIAEKTDAIVIVVSEETGHISVAIGETIQPIKLDEIQKMLAQEMPAK